ncbi:MAG: hypothetical protein WAM17_01425 [Rhodoplanes sp.]
MTAIEERPDKSEMLALSVDRRQLGEFIASLLGQRRRLTRTYNVRFEISWNWILNLDEMIIHRVEEQNDGSLIEFSAEIDFENGKTTHIGSRSELKAFRDVSDLAVIGIELTWTFIIKFPTSKNPEKQEVNLLAQTHRIDLHSRTGNFHRDYFNDPDNLNEELYLEISYSNLTWGDDLMNTISAAIFSAFPTRGTVYPNIVSFLRRFAPIFVVMLMFIGLFIIASNETNKVHTATKERWAAIGSGMQRGAAMPGGSSASFSSTRSAFLRLSICSDSRN